MSIRTQNGQIRFYNNLKCSIKKAIIRSELWLLTYVKLITFAIGISLYISRKVLAA